MEQFGSLPLGLWLLGLTSIVLIAWAAYEWWKYHHMRRQGDPHSECLVQKSTAAIVTAIAIPVTMLAAYAVATPGP